MSEADERAAIVAEALSWLGTTYRHAGRARIRRDARGNILERGGADCAVTFLIYRAAVPHLVPALDLPAWGPHWNLSRATAAAEYYLAAIAAIPSARELRSAREAGPGDLAVYRFGHAWAHGAIVLGWPAILHADAGSLAVTRAVAQGPRAAHRLAARPVRFFTLW